MTQSVGRVMRTKGSGLIINLVDVDQESVRNEAAFVASMQGLIGFTQQAARELSPYGIRVYAVETNEDVVKNVFALLEEK